MTLGETHAAARAEIDPLFSGLLHFAFTNLVGLGVIAYAASQVRGPRSSLLTGPVTFLYANAVEYFLHKGPMHHRARFCACCTPATPSCITPSTSRPTWASAATTPPTTTRAL
jgi:hypothetical protein